MDEQIIFKLLRQSDLDYTELCHVFNNIGVRIALNYDKSYRAIKYLLKNLKNEQRDALVKLINKDYQIWPHFTVDLFNYSDHFDCWLFRCNNKKTEKFLITLHTKMVEQENDSALNNFKDTLTK